MSNPVVDFMKDKIKEYGHEVWWIKDKGFRVIEDEYQDSSRWTENWRAILEVSTPGYNDEVSYVAIEYDKPATESQEGSETDPEYWDVYEVKPQEKVVIEFVRVASKN